MNSSQKIPSVVNVNLNDLANTVPAPIADDNVWRVVGSDRPLCAAVDSFVSNDKRLRIGVARYDRVTLDLCNWRWDVFMFIYEGEVEITDHTGSKTVHGPGSAFVIPRGFKGLWRELSDVKKIHIIYE